MALRTPSEAVDYAMTHLTTGYNGLCLAHVQDAYGARAVEPSAISAWNNSRYKHPTTDLAGAPYGAPIYWSQPGNPYGHIALHLSGDQMYTTDSGVGHPHTASIGDWQRRYGYKPLGWTEDIENQPIPGLTKEEDMQPIDIWNYPIGSEGTPGLADQQAWVRLSWIHKDTERIWALLSRTDDGNTGDKTNGNIYERVCHIDMRVREMTTTIQAQAAAIEALSQAMGADPDQIAQAVKDAVTAKLDSLQITITATDGDDQ